MLRSSPSLAEVKKKGRMKKLSQTAEQDLIMGLQGLVRGSWDNQNPKVLHPGQCGMFPLIQAHVEYLLTRRSEAKGYLCLCD